MIFEKHIKRGFLVLVGGLLNFLGHAQSSSSDYIPKLIPPSPNAATIAKYSDVPVSTYNGTSDISVPIFNIQARGLSIPVSLGYHTGGIRLKEEAGWVGLGWALNAGGSISRTIMDKDDFGGHYFNMPIPEVSTNVQTQTSFPDRVFMGTYGYDFYCNYLVNTDAGVVDFSNAFASGGGLYDNEPDIFNYSFPGHSGKFMITRTGKVLIQKQENIKIEFETNGNSFTITDESGNKFYFLVKEYTKGQQPDAKVSSWMLSSIITQLNDTVTFSYAQDNTWTGVPAEIYETSRIGCAQHQGLTSIESTGNEYMNVTLQKIDYSGGQLQFAFDGNRIDLQNGKKLNNVKIYAKNGNGSLTYVKEHDFYYSYFNATKTPATEFTRLRLDSVKEISGTLSIPAYAFTYFDPNNNSLSGKRSHSVDDWGFFNGKINSTFIPPFQGIYENTSLQPTYINDPGADRTPDPDFMQFFSLQKVKYPTGGSTVLEYEANDYDKNNSQKGGTDFVQQQLVDTTWRLTVGSAGTVSGSIDFSHIFQTMPNINIGSNATLSIAFLGRNGSDASDLHNGTNGQVYFTFMGQSYDISSNVLGISCPFGALCTTPSIPLAINNATSFPFTAFVASGATSKLSSMNITITWQELREVHFQNSNPSLLAGGLRIKTITDYNTDNTITKKRKYDYNSLRDDLGTGTPQKYSLGRLMSFPAYARYEPFAAGGSTPSCLSLTRTGSSNSSITSVINGNIVAYDSVAEYTIDPVTGVDIGKTVYSYYNSPDLSQPFGGFRLPGIFNEGDNLNGSLLRKVVYSQKDGVYKKISETVNFFHVTNKSLYYSLKSSFAGLTSGSAVFRCPNGVCVPLEYIGNFYPSLKSERVLLDSTTSTTYDQFDDNKSVSSKTRNYYDNALHYQLTRTTQQDSKGNFHVSVIKYPQDYIPSGLTVTNNTILDALISRNMVSEVIEKRDSILYQGSSSGAKVTGAQFSKYKTISGSSMAMDKQYKFDQSAPVSDFQPFAISGNTTSMDSRYRQLISFDSYDNTNNIGQYTPVDQTSVSVLWDYANIYPIAQVKNAALADIAFTSFEADGNGGWTINSTIRDNTAALTGNQCYNLSNGSISKSGLTNGKVYMLTYWSQSGSYTVSGGSVTSKIGRTVNSWTYYEQTLTASATTITLSGSGKIDELRLYPKGALMTSYTYSPLVGQSASDDPSGEITYYDYDVLTRLKNIRDYQGNIIKNFQYNYGTGCTDCYLPMQTFGGTGTLSYPVGVFNVNGKLLGNATSQTQYLSLWNADTVNQTIGTLTAGADSLHFKISYANTKVSLSAVTGCRYYQYDFSYNIFDGVRNRNAAYIDFGDGTGMRLGSSYTDSLIPLAPNTSYKTIFAGDIDADETYFQHAYSDASLKTLTFYHNDANETDALDNAFKPASSLLTLTNLRGNLPQSTTLFGGSSYQQSAANTVANIPNWNSIQTITQFNFNNGDGVNPPRHLNFTQDFMQNSVGLQMIRAGYSDSTFKISRLKTDWNTFFKQLNKLSIYDDMWDHEDLSGLKRLSSISLNPTTTTHRNGGGTVIPILSQAIDSLLVQVARGAGQVITGGSIGINTGGSNRTSASDASVNFLLSRSWTININGTVQVGLQMQTFAGTATLSYPVGVFNVNGKLLGNATTQSQYVTLWNADTADQHRGVLATGGDSLNFILALASGATAPSATIGCRYYQYDISYTKIDGIRNSNGVYVDFGDGAGMKLGHGPSDSAVVLAANTSIVHIGTLVYFVHTYPDNTLKTISIYHNDATESFGLDNGTFPATSITLVTNIRGNFPQLMTDFAFSSYQQSSALTVANITNWNSIFSITKFKLNNGDNANPSKNLSYAQDFMQANQGLTFIETAHYGINRTGYRDTTFKMSRLKSDWNTYFKQLHYLVINDDHWSREDLSGLKMLDTFGISATRQNHQDDLQSPVVQIPTQVIDTIINQIAAGAGQTISNGLIVFWSGGTLRTSASDTAFAYLKSRGWIFFFEGVQY